MQQDFLPLLRNMELLKKSHYSLEIYSLLQHVNKMTLLILVSTFYKGEQMVEVFNALNVDVACLGNHDFVFESS